VADCLLDVLTAILAVAQTLSDFIAMWASIVMPFLKREAIDKDCEF
jgi:hypothetical protein